MKMTKAVTMMLLTTVATSGMIQSVGALEAQAFVDRVEQVYRHLGYELKFGPAKVDGDAVIVEGVTANLVETPNAEGVTTETPFTFSGVTEREDGSYMVDSLTVPDLDTPIVAKPPGNVTLADIRVEGLYLPAGDPTAADKLQLIKSISTGALTVTRQGENVIEMDSLEAASTFTPEQGSSDLDKVSSELRLNGLRFDLGILNDVMGGHAAPILEETGLSDINGEITQTITWSLEDGHLVMDEFLFDFDNQGALNVAFDITGATPELIDQARGAALEGEGASDAQQKVKHGMALDEIMLVSASIHYDDASLVDNVIAFYAEKSGVDRATYAEWLQAQAANFLVSAGLTPLTDLINPGIDNFLDDPQSIAIAINPPSPVPLAVLLEGAANPENLIPALGLAGSRSSPTGSAQSTDWQNPERIADIQDGSERIRAYSVLIGQSVYDEMLAANSLESMMQERNVKSVNIIDVTEALTPTEVRRLENAARKNESNIRDLQSQLELTAATKAKLEEEDVLPASVVGIQFSDGGVLDVLVVPTWLIQ